MLDLSKIAAEHNHIRFAPDAVRCPRCRHLVPRHEVRCREFWTTAAHTPTITHVHFGYYVCPTCPTGQRGFSVLPPDFRTSAQYDRPTQKLVLSAVLDLNASHCAAAKWAKTHLHLPYLHDTTISQWIMDQAHHIDETAHRAALLASFSGQMCIDELYDGAFCVLRVTDPLNNQEIAFQLLEGTPTADDVRALLEELKAEGYSPQIVNTDGSTLYPGVLAAVWPDALHQRCVFHFLMQLFKQLGHIFWAAYKTMPKPPKRKRGRPKKKGRKRKDKEKKANREAVRAVRWRILKNPCALSDAEAKRLAYALHLCPPLRDLRRLVIALIDLFGPNTETRAQAEQKRAAICADERMTKLDKSAPLLDKLNDLPLFEKLTAYLHFENAVKTTNHVERENRAHRHRQKVRFRYRSRQALQALLVLLHHRQRPKTYRDGTERTIIKLVRRRPEEHRQIQEVQQAA